MFPDTGVGWHNVLPDKTHKEGRHTDVIHLDVGFVFERAGGPSGLLQLFDRYVSDHDLNYSTVQMWKHRNRVAGNWVAPVVYCLVREGIAPLSLFLEDQEFREG